MVTKWIPINMDLRRQLKMLCSDCQASTTGLSPAQHHVLRSVGSHSLWTGGTFTISSSPDNCCAETHGHLAVKPPVLFPFKPPFTYRQNVQKWHALGCNSLYP